MKRLVTAFAFLGIATSVLAGTWEYRQEEDKMDSSVTKFALLRSENSMTLPFPYSGENHAHLAVRSRKSDGLNVMFSIDKGQLICGYNDCSVMIRFDTGQPIRFGASKPADSSSTVLFVSNARRFVELAKSAKQIRLAATVYQSGTQVLEFTSAVPLVWDVPKAAPKAPPRAQPDLTGLSQLEKMKACNTGASGLTGDDRKQYMMQCLK